VILSVKEIGEANAALAAEGLLGVRSTLASLGHAEEPSWGYHRSGERARSERSGRILERSV